MIRSAAQSFRSLTFLLFFQPPKHLSRHNEVPRRYRQPGDVVSLLSDSSHKTTLCFPAQKYQTDNSNVALHRISDYFNTFGPITKTPGMSHGVFPLCVQGAPPPQRHSGRELINLSAGPPV